MHKNAPIGIFDSGIGGLTIAKAVKKTLPNERILYYGDTLHLPYGEKSAVSIQHYAAGISRFLNSKNCKAVLIACNSASSVALEQTKNELNPNTILLNVIDPLVEHTAKKYKGKTIGVIGTKATINSCVYQKKLTKHCTVKTLCTPLLAPMIEEGFINNKISSTVIEEYIKNSNLKDLDALLLGCTHYPIIQKEIKEIYNNSVDVIDSSIWIAKALEKELTNKKLLCSSHQPSEDEFYVSDRTTSFEKSAHYFFGKSVALKELKID